MTAPEELLTLWRIAAPGELSAPRGLSASLLAFLAARLDPQDAREKQLLDQVLLRDTAADLCVRREDLPALPAEVVQAMRDAFARHAGIRQLKRAIEAALARAQDLPRRLN